MKWFLYILVAILLTGCSDCSYDFSVPNAYRQFLKNYQVGDVIYFESNWGDLDTMRIARFDSTERCSGLMVAPEKSFQFEIHHLPNNNWTGGTEHSQNGRSNILNQDLIILSKDLEQKDSCTLYFSYRDFSGTLRDISRKVKDPLFSDLGVSEYWVIPKINYSSDTAIPDTVIHRIFWSEEYGLTGYAYSTGEFYRIKQ